MVDTRSMWHIRGRDEEFDLKIYELYTTLMSMKIHHGGVFTEGHDMKYLNGKVTYVDLIDTEHLSANDLVSITQELGYPDHELIFYHFKRPYCDLKSGLQALRNDEDVSALLKYVPQFNLIDVYTEHWETKSDTYDVKIEELPYDDKSKNLLLDWHSNNSEKSIEVDKNDNVEVPLVDEDNMIVDVEVDMIDDVEVYETNLEDFDSKSDSDFESTRKKRIRKAQKHNAAVVSSNHEFCVGQTFGSKEDVKKLIKLHAIETRRKIVIKKNDRTRLRAVCKGKLPIFTSEPGEEIVEEEKIDEKCNWVLHVSIGKDDETWMVKTHKKEHKCLQSRDVNACTASFLSQHIAETIAPNPDIPILAIQEQLERKYSVDVSVIKSFRAKAEALKKIRGDYTEQYGKLRDYVLELQRTNDDTTVKIHVDTATNLSSDTRKFSRIYICFGALKKGFKACMRDLLGLDGCFMKGPFPGQILTAVGIDPNNGTYPLAYAIVEAETKSSWTWFLECIGDDLDLSRNSNFTFISDRQKGIVPAIASLFPCAEHRFCLRHIHENMKLSWKGKAFKDHLWKCATASNVPMFNQAMDDFKTFNDGAHKWLKEIPSQHWSRAYFTGRCHSDILLNNICEVFNRQLVNGRDKPIITALEFIRQYLMKKIVNVQKVIAKCNGPLTPAATKLFSTIKEEAVHYVVQWNGGGKYEVTGRWNDKCVVDAQHRTCSCRRWELTGMPCKHAVATIWFMALNGEGVRVPENWVHSCYFLSTWQNVYSFKMGPINGPNFWPKSGCPSTLIAPRHHVQVGRPKKKRKRTTDELSQSIVKGSKISKVGTTVTCAKCHKKGHNSRTCKGQGI